MDSYLLFIIKPLKNQNFFMSNFQNDIVLLEQLIKGGENQRTSALTASLLKNTTVSSKELIAIGTLLMGHGDTSKATQCFKQVLELDDQNYDAKFSLANCLYALGDHQESIKIQSQLLAEFPNSPSLRRNYLLSMEYDPALSDHDRFNNAIEWGQWVTQLTGHMARPKLKKLNNRKLKIGYVSADLCQHTVGLFIKDVIQAHHKEQVDVYCYYSNTISDWVTKSIQAASNFRFVYHLSDSDLAAQIKRDEIDVLIDLSGHTRGSRLTVFALRPAPVQVSWLGYFATTGLSSIDAVLLDAGHVTQDTSKYFVEQIYQLNHCRFFYNPVSWAKEYPISNLPASKNGFITFGSFNSTSKLNETVINVWSKILNSVQNSKLVLKWRTFIDPLTVELFKDKFVRNGVNPNNIEFQSASFHSDLFKEYDKIDIALDPFPFTGGLTSCEALWMGLPIVTLPQSHVVSRQTNSILRAIGFTETIADSQHDYIQKAINLAADYSRLNSIRQSLRPMMLSSPLMNVDSFTRGLEDILVDLYKSVESAENR